MQRWSNIYPTERLKKLHYRKCQELQTPWVLYKQLVRAAQNFILAVRLHYWHGYMNAASGTIGIFPSAGHGQYPKFGRMYLKEMLRLPEDHPQVSIIQTN